MIYVRGFLGKGSGVIAIVGASRNIFILGFVWWLTNVAVQVSTITIAKADTAAVATKLYSRLASATLGLTDPKRTQMETLINQGNLLGAAQIATSDDRFYNITVRTWATPMANRAEDPIIAQNYNNSIYLLNDFVAMIIGTVRDERNAQELLNGDFTYMVSEPILDAAGLPIVEAYKPINTSTSDAKHFYDLNRLNINLRQKLVRTAPQRPDFSDAAGVLTSQAWGVEHYFSGTNRRPLQYALKEFLCVDIDDVRDPSLPVTRIRRDVSRAPGGSTTTFETTCRACHTGMDGLAGAFAYYNLTSVSTTTLTTYANPPGYFAGTQLARAPNAVNPTGGIASKMNQNGSIFPSGYVTIDDSWINYFASSSSTSNINVGWPATMTSGKGIKSLGTMLANTKAFPRCMTKRVFRKVCGREPSATEGTLIQSISDQFVSGGYNLKSLFERVAIEAACIGR
jgi:hypothetical protein